jgi:hypothetical protein
LLAARAGQGEDAAKLDHLERTRLRRQALDWLRADLALRTKQLESGAPADRAEAQKALRHWQKDPDLAGIRVQAALAKLPEEDRAACVKLWADVAELLKRAEETAKQLRFAILGRERAAVARATPATHLQPPRCVAAGGWVRLIAGAGLPDTAQAESEKPRAPTC